MYKKIRKVVADPGFAEDPPGPAPGLATLPGAFVPVRDECNAVLVARQTVALAVVSTRGFAGGSASKAAGTGSL